MPTEFLQYLTLILITLLFADKYAPALLKKFFGVSIDGNNKQDEINEKMEIHAQVANHEMGDIKTDIAVIKTDISTMKEDVRAIKEKVFK